MFSLSGKMDFQIPCFPCAVATLRKYYNSTATFRLDVCRKIESSTALCLIIHSPGPGGGGTPPADGGGGGGCKLDVTPEAGAAGGGGASANSW